MNLAPLDLAILLLYLAGVVVLGLWMGRGSRSVSDYVVGDRHQPWWLILGSIVATETSTVTFLSIPGFAYSRDLTWLQLPLGFLAGRFAVAWLLLPRYFQGSILTSYEVLRERFGGATQRVASALFLLTRSLADGLRLFLTAIVVEEMAGIPLAWAVVVTGLATLAYCYFGGMRAVLWTDFVQLAVYLGGAVIALQVLLARLPGGWGQLVEMGGAAGKLKTFDLGWSLSEPHLLWAGLLGGAFLTLGSHGVDQLMVQRYLSAGSLPAARRALTASGFVVLGQFALFLVLGVGLWCFYQLSPPAVPFDRPDRVFVRFILEEMPPGLVGVLIGAIFAAAMSTLSSSLNSCAAAAANDFFPPRAGAEGSPERRLRLAKGLTALFGLIQIGVGIAGQWLATSVVNAVLGIAAFTTGIVLGLFFLGALSRRVGQRAALVGLVLGLAGMTWVYFGTSLAWPWYALVGSLGTLVLGLGASLVWPEEPPQLPAQGTGSAV
ncbi:MAG TPA: sodium:solute symporter [Thermoanaerobaculia bacterium]|nr:sodium:solute symporter [Thermoanaerobaculia bacterium]